MAPDLALDSIAYRRTLAAGCVAFPVGCITAFAGLLALFAYFGMTSGGWAGILQAVVHATWISLTVGGVLAAGAMQLADRWYHWREAFHCPYCGRPTRYRATPPCVCWKDPGHPMAEIYARSLKRHRPPRLRHYRRQLPTALGTYAALVPVVLVAVAVVRHFKPREASFLSEFVMVHVLATVLVAIALEMTASMLEMLKRGRRFRLRCVVLTRTLLLGPAVVFVVAGARALIRLL